VSKIRWFLLAVGLLVLAGVYPVRAGAPSHAQPTPTLKICHLCDDEPATPLPTQPQARVRLVLFWLNGCPHCHDVLENVLPPLQAQYGDALEVRLIEITTQDDVDYFYTVAEAYGIPRQQAGVPFLIINGVVLKGSGEIREELPGQIARILAHGGCDWPTLPERPAGAAVQTATSPPAGTAADTGSTAQGPHNALGQAVSDFGLIIGLMLAMVLALLYTLGSLAVRAARPPRRPQGSESHRRWGWVLPFLAFLGLGIAAYLTFIEVTASTAVCGPVGDCNAVQSSAYARLGGVVPVALLGVLGYLAVLLVWAWGRLGQGALAARAPWVLFGLALVGVPFSLYLAYLEAFVIRAVCLWCSASGLVMTLILLFSLREMPPSGGNLS